MSDDKKETYEEQQQPSKVASQLLEDAYFLIHKELEAGGASSIEELGQCKSNNDSSTTWLDPGPNENPLSPPPEHPREETTMTTTTATARAAVVRAAVSAVTETATTPVVTTAPPLTERNEPPASPLVQPEETTKTPPEETDSAVDTKTSTTVVTKNIGTGGRSRPAAPPQPPGPILSTSDLRPMDVLSGRGASINTRPGNKKFRALCFVRKRHFEAGNHAAKRQLALEVVSLMVAGTDPFVVVTTVTTTAPAAVTTTAAAASETAPKATIANTSSDAVTTIRLHIQDGDCEHEGYDEDEPTPAGSVLL